MISAVLLFLAAVLTLAHSSMLPAADPAPPAPQYHVHATPARPVQLSLAPAARAKKKKNCSSSCTGGCHFCCSQGSRKLMGQCFKTVCPHLPKKSVKKRACSF